jgi:putative ABC transport system permease protein
MLLVYSLLTAGLLAGFFGPVLYWDKGRRSLVLAVRSLWLHKLRAFLSVLGIIIGTGAVIALMAFGEGSMQDALEDIKRMGATNIIVRSVKPPDNSSTSGRQRVAIYGITHDDFERFAVLQEGGTVTRMVPMRVFPCEMRRYAVKFNGRVVGTTPEYAQVNELPLALGRFLVEEDERTMDNVAVIGSNVAESMFPFENPLGKTIRLDRFFYVIVGVMHDRMPTGGTGGSQAAEDYNDDVYIPLSTCKARFGETITVRQAGSYLREQVNLHQVTLTVCDTDKVRPTGEVIKTMLSRHVKPDWAVTVPLDKLEAAEREKSRFTRLMAMIASISLFVGGIGIMNIMLATVTERTREIGIRRALGAKRRDITMQFLIEAVVQTSLGGLLGVVTGLLVIFVVPMLSERVLNEHLPAKVHVPAIFLSLMVSIGVGVAFGLYPAWKASRLDPIEALRHE